MKSIETLINEEKFRLRDDTKFYHKIYECPFCGSKSADDLSEFDCIPGKSKDKFYQYYMMRCNDCGKTYYNVFSNLGALSGEQFDKIVKPQSVSFARLASDPE